MSRLLVVTAFGRRPGGFDNTLLLALRGIDRERRFTERRMADEMAARLEEPAA